MAPRTTRTKNAIDAVLGPWSEGPGPLHRKLADAIRHAIELGYIAVDERLPSERELAVRLAVSRSTVVAAYDALRSEGLLESRQGSGTRVRPAGRVIRPAEVIDHRVSPVYRSLLDARDDLISLACAAFPSHPMVREALHAMVAEDGDKLLLELGYMPAGLPELREAIAEMFTLNGTPTTPDQIVVTTGAQQAVGLAGALLVRPGDDVVVESPSFAGTLDAFRTRGARLACAPIIDDDGVDVDAIAALVRTRDPSAIYVMPSFHNPTGALMAEWRRRRLAELASSQGVPVIEDNALENVALDDAVLPPIACFAGPDAPVLTAGSLGKVAWGGLRVGWLRGPIRLIERIAEMKAMTDLGSPLLDQAVAARIVPRLDQLRQDHRVRLQCNFDLIAGLLNEHLPEWEWRRPRGGPSLWVRMPSGSAAAFSQLALRYGVEIIPGESMSPASEHRDYFRFPFSAEPTVLEETVRRLSAAWRAYSPRREEPFEPSPRVVV
jgi:DNA-binding transcriptional MocR family regulator